MLLCLMPQGRKASHLEPLEVGGRKDGHILILGSHKHSRLHSKGKLVQPVDPKIGTVSWIAQLCVTTRVMRRERQSLKEL